ncbi:MAG: hypothetical protein UT66_C0005G0010 [candidate division CPR2 bacterium GW2011_GWC1_39_9]|uniref:Uncharacterized protein n=1 Tax=candidate division CPR2 bacterium GW2011_GWC2_39_10 TaxID=1618345 RepID=A0A0G0Q0B2_UNCC2|nr:MAG: hypothetical protein UT18_C0004G0043 [candidate division CPR2 bacterium GW2011_GWC2_39_10]KKR35974.1 MAG: hypothetical protein UT66_C0005G0010 [candidate division CPR2 bacterium GW2011_GWC1_39_9]
MKLFLKRKAGYAIATIAGLALLSGNIFAAKWSAGNDTTGANSENDAIINVKNDAKIENENRTDVDNNARVKANTGDNEANYNTGSGTVRSGDIDLAFDIATMIGFEDMDMDMGGGTWSISVGNKTTGYNSDNDAKVKISNKFKLKNENKTDIDNYINACLNTGDNEANYNTGNGSITSGDIDFETKLKSQVDLGSGGPLAMPKMGDISAGNNKTGANSENDAIVNLTNKMTIENENKTNIDNKICINANTGDNEANYNTGNGSVTSGDISGSVAVTNTVK